MKYNILAAVVAGALLSACNNGSGSDSSSTYSLQAYDPAIQGMSVSYDCDDASGTSGVTDYDGNAIIENETVVNAPDLCEFTFTGGTDAIDTSNSKSMDGVTYTIPKGLAQAGTKATGSPLTTLIADQLDGADYDETTAATVLTNLGLYDLLVTDNSVSISDLLLDTETVASNLTGTTKATLLATTAVLSDIITKTTSTTSTTKTLTEVIAEAAKDYADAIVTAYPDYPTSTTDDDVVLTVSITDDADTIIADDDIAAEVSSTVTEGEVVVNTDDATGTGTGTGSTSSGN